MTLGLNLRDKLISRFCVFLKDNVSIGYTQSEQVVLIPMLIQLLIL